ncbi:MAG: metal-dependent transcriptional regulator [Chitinophagaceae bacterium]
MQTLSEENYLKTIYHIGRQGNEKISPTAVADALHNNPASVIDMLKKLVDKNLVAYEKKKGVKLTEKGLKIALQVIRRHRLWEVFLLEKLGYAWDEIHDMAEQLEHIQPQDIADRLEKFLGFPQYDPHGDPIPKSNGQLPVVSKTTLSEVGIGQVCQVVAIRDTSVAFLQYLERFHIGIGTRIRVLEKIDFDDSMGISIGKSGKAVVSKKFAENLLIGF